MIGPTAAWYEDPAQYFAPDATYTPAMEIADFLKDARGLELLSIADNLIDRGITIETLMNWSK